MQSIILALHSQLEMALEHIVVYLWESWEAVVGSMESKELHSIYLQSPFWQTTRCKNRRAGPFCTI